MCNISNMKNYPAYRLNEPPFLLTHCAVAAGCHHFGEPEDRIIKYQLQWL
jgi:hypothetical protein